MSGLKFKKWILSKLDTLTFFGLPNPKRTLKFKILVNQNYKK